ncbi:hypothetical protein ScPMuIL_009707 [Solemya velum]
MGMSQEVRVTWCYRLVIPFQIGKMFGVLRGGERWILLAHLLYLTHTALAQTTRYMDSLSTCGNTYYVNDNRDLVLGAKSRVTPSNPSRECIVVVESEHTSSNYLLHIILEAVNIEDCAMQLTVYNGQGAYGSPLKTLSCGSPSTGLLYTQTHSATFRLMQPVNLYQTNNDFTIRVRSFRNPDDAAYISGTSRLSAGAIVGIILGLVAIIAVAILLCWCVKSGRLGFDKAKGSPVYKSKSGFSESERGTDNPSSETIDKESLTTVSKGDFNLKDPRMWSSLTATESKPRPKRTDMIKSGQPHEPGGRDTGRFLKRDETVSGSDATRRDERNTGTSSPGRMRGRLEQSDPNPRNSPGRSRGCQGGKETDIDFKYQNVENSKYENVEYKNRRNDAGHGSLGRGQTELRKDNKPVSSQQSDGNKETGDKSKESKKRPNSGFFENPDEEGYMYDYDHVKSLSADDIHKHGGEAPGAPKGNTKTDNVPEISGTLDSLMAKNAKYMSQDELSEPAESDTMGNPMINRSHDAIKSAVNPSGPEPFESPSTPKKKVTANPSKHKEQIPDTKHSEDETKKTDTEEIEASPKKFRPIKEPGGLSDDKRFDSSLPPEAYAPIFANDPATMEHYYPPQEAQYGYPVNYGYGQPGMMAPYMGGDPNQPYAQAGQAVWYAQATPQGAGPVKQSTFMMSTMHSTPTGSNYEEPQYPPGGAGYYDPNTGTPYGDITHPGLPGYTSTPSAFTPHKRGHHGPHHHGHRSKSKPSPYYPENYTVTPGGPVHPHAIVPAGTVLDDPYVPGPGGTVVRTGQDPNTGARINQVVWTDTNPDPTDPVGSDPQITRKTITRVTTKSNNNQGSLPDPPNPTLNELSFRAAQQLRDGVEPSFLSPTKQQAVTYNPQPVYKSQQPSRDNVGFYSNMQHSIPISETAIPGSPMPVVHQAPKQSRAIKDSISLSQLQEHDDI